MPKYPLSSTDFFKLHITMCNLNNSDFPSKEYNQQMILNILDYILNSPISVEGNKPQQYDYDCINKFMIPLKGITLKEGFNKK